MTRARSWLARHLVLTAWALFGATIASVAFLRGQSPIAALGIGTALGGLIVLVPFMFDPFPFPLSREQWPMRLLIMRDLARKRHWANLFYVEVVTLRSAWRPSYCAEQLAAALLKFPWLPVGQHSMAGWMRGDRFVLKRITWWANGMRPTASGRLQDIGAGTTLVVWVGALAVGAYTFLVFLVMVVTFMVLLAVGVVVRTVESGASPTTLVLLVFAGLLLTLVATLLFASPVPLPIGGPASEADRFIAFFDDVLGADVVSRE